LNFVHDGFGIYSIRLMSAEAGGVEFTNGDTRGVPINQKTEFRRTMVIAAVVVRLFR
jgi:hypothetical protein